MSHVLPALSLRRVVAPACVALGFALAGCGDDDTSNSNATTPAASTSTPAKTTPAKSETATKGAASGSNAAFLTQMKAAVKKLRAEGFKVGSPKGAGSTGGVLRVGNVSVYFLATPEAAEKAEKQLKSGISQGDLKSTVERHGTHVYLSDPEGGSTAAAELAKVVGALEQT